MINTKVYLLYVFPSVPQTGAYCSVQNAGQEAPSPIDAAKHAKKKRIKIVKLRIRYKSGQFDIEE